MTKTENRFLWHVSNQPDGLVGMDGSGGDPEFVDIGDTQPEAEIELVKAVTEGEQ